MTNVVNAEISQAFIGMEGHDIFCFSIAFKFGPHGGTHQGFGAFALQEAAPLEAVLRCLELNDWSKVEGSYCRVQFDGDPIYVQSRPIRMGHITKDKWTGPDEWTKALNA